jgi:hypothetical protein
MDAYALLAALENARLERGGGVPLNWSEIADELGIHAAAFSRLKTGTLPGPKTLRSILEWLELELHEFAVSGDGSLPIGGRDTEWDGQQATNRIFEWATSGGKIDPKKARNGFFFVDPNEDPTTRAAYKLPFCDLVGKTLTIMPRGIAATAGGHGVDSVSGASAAEKAAIKKKICKVYVRIVDKYHDWPDCPFDADGTRPDRRERRNDKAIEDHETDTQEEEDTMDEETKTAGIIGTGSLSQSEDPRTQALVTRVAELLREGAVAVSIRHDMHPDATANIAALVEAGDMEGAEAAMESADIRPRHVAIVDTAAFSDARFTLGDDGFSVEGPVVFEGIYTGDMRTLRYGSLVWDEELLPIPIIWDPDNNDHDGVVVGFVSSLERIDGMSSAVRPSEVGEEEVEAVNAAAGSSGIDPALFARFKASGKLPLKVDEPDKNGFRRISGHVAPFGVCHRSDMGACFQMPKDVDKTHSGFHTGFPLTLSDGSVIRPGAMTLGGKHLNAGLAKQGVQALDTGNHRDDANTVFAVVMAWEDSFGLAVSGILMPDIDQTEMLRAAACGPSVELWPSNRGRTLVGIHLVPTPAWPVAASAGEAQTITDAVHLEIEGLDLEDGACCETCADNAAQAEPWGYADIEASLKRMESALALLASEALTNVPLPEETGVE